MEKRDNEIFMQLPQLTWSSISREAGQATAQENNQCQSKVQFVAVEQEKKGGA